MRQAVEALSALNAAISRVVILLAGIALLVLVVMMGWAVFGRYVMNDTPTWVEKGALLTVLFVSLPVAAVGIRERFHMAIEVGLSAMPRSWREPARITSDVLLLLLAYVMITGSWVLVSQMAPFKIPLLGVSQALQFLPMTICGALTMLFVTEHLLRRFVGLKPVGAAPITLD